MSIRLGVTVVAATFLFGSASSLRAGGGATAPVAVASPGSVPATRLADLARQAPVGHRQPRRSDVPGSAQASPEDMELRRLDKEIDRRLIICRGC